ncbi:peptidylprolyl isomerase [Stieleria marina]|uniref:Periplasmic chaperone PpiD n=1 Tax=Stieleria marina TaxID=1930275 RepID=A0A517NTE0_9BACT|nr:Peptidyl-prolyl cis-trans isomerase D [Planctomycetes bacterium K23_9]
MPSRSTFIYKFVLILLSLSLGALQIGATTSFAQQPLSSGPAAGGPPPHIAAAIAQAKDANLPTDPAAVIAVVGTSQILLGDVKGKVDARIKEVLAKAGQEVPQEILLTARVNLTRGMLQQAIQSKQMRESFLLEQVGTQGADKRREAAEMMSSRARQMFYETEVKQLKEKFECTTLVELDKKLRTQGSSLKARERDFMDAMLGHMYMRSSVEKDPHVTLSEINTHYITHRDDYFQQSRATWEQFTVLFANHESREAALAKLNQMGAEAYYGGNLQAIAKQKSEEPFAAEGGLHGWTKQGSLASKELDKQIFSLPLNKMSEIIEDETGFHIVRVLDREDAGIKPRAQVQESIKEKLKQAKVAKSQKAMIEAMRDKVPVWSIFPEDIPGAMPLNMPAIPTLPNAKNY